MASLGYECIEGEELITSTIPDDAIVIVSDDMSAISNELAKSFFKRKRTPSICKNSIQLSTLRSLA